MQHAFVAQRAAARRKRARLQVALAAACIVECPAQALLNHSHTNEAS
jgi:hypothetical protein